MSVCLEGVAVLRLVWLAGLPSADTALLHHCRGLQTSKSINTEKAVPIQLWRLESKSACTSCKSKAGARGGAFQQLKLKSCRLLSIVLFTPFKFR